MYPGLAFVDGKVRFRSRSTDINTNLHRWLNLLNYLINYHGFTFVHYT